MNFYEIHQIIRMRSIAKSNKQFFVFTKLLDQNNKHQTKKHNLVLQQFVQQNSSSKDCFQIQYDNPNILKVQNSYRMEGVNYFVFKPQYETQFKFCFLRDFSVQKQIQFMLQLFQQINRLPIKNLNPYTVLLTSSSQIYYLPSFYGLDKHLNRLFQQQIKQIGIKVDKQYLTKLKFAYTCYVILQSRSLDDIQRLTTDPILLKNLCDCTNQSSQINFQILVLLRNIFCKPHGEVSKIVIEQYLKMVKEKNFLSSQHKNNDLIIKASICKQKKDTKKTVKRKSFKQSSLHQSFHKNAQNAPQHVGQTRLKHSNSLTSLTSGSYKGRKYKKTKLKYPYNRQRDLNSGEVQSQAAHSVQFLKSYKSSSKSRSLIKNRSNVIFPMETNTSQFYLSMTNNSKGGAFGFNPALSGQSNLLNINTSSSFFKASATQQKLKRLNVKQMAHTNQIMSESSEKDRSNFLGSEMEPINESMIQSKLSQMSDISFSKPFFRQSQNFAANSNLDMEIVNNKKPRKPSINLTSNIIRQEINKYKIAINNSLLNSQNQASSKIKKRDFDFGLVSDIAKKIGIQLESKNIEVVIKPRVKKHKLNSSVFSINERLSNPSLQNKKEKQGQIISRTKNSQGMSAVDQLKRRIILSHLDKNLATPTKKQYEKTEQDQLQDINFSRTSKSKNTLNLMKQNYSQQSSITKNSSTQKITPQQKKMLENYSVTLNVINKIQNLCSIQKVNSQLKFQKKGLFQICIITCFCKKVGNSLLEYCKSQKISEKISVLNSKYNKWKAALIKNPQQFFDQQNIKYLEEFQKGNQDQIPSEQLAKVLLAQVQSFSSILQTKKVTLDQMVIKNGLCYLVMMATMINILADPIGNKASWDVVKQKCKYLQEKQNIKMLNLKDYYNSNIKVSIRM